LFDELCARLLVTDALVARRIEQDLAFDRTDPTLGAMLGPLLAEHRPSVWRSRSPGVGLQSHVRLMGMAVGRLLGPER
jgi:hypothetical protein